MSRCHVVRIALAMTFLPTSSSLLLKSVRQILRKPQPHWVGDGFHVYPIFADKAFSAELSPFLMFDYGKAKYFPPTQKKLGVGRHPHRGFETVTIAFQGEIEHGDNKGNIGVIGPDDVQWMTAARGIIHEEFHSRRFAKNGGILEMCQLWVNLPRKHKMTNPRYQPILANDIPSSPLFLYQGQDSSNELASATCTQANMEHGYVRVIAGSFHGVIGPAKTFSQVDVFDIHINNKEYTFEFDTVNGNNVVLFVRSGKVKIQGDTILGPQDVVLMDRHDERTKLTIQSLVDHEEGTDLDDGSAGAKLLLLAGEPFIDEPIANHGPFVMNTQDELRQAFEDYNAGKF